MQPVKLVGWLALAAMLVATPPARAEETPERTRPLTYSPGAGLRVGRTGLTLGGYGNVELTRDEGGPARVTVDALALFVTWDPLSSLHFFSELEGEDLVSVDDHGRGGAVDARFAVERLYGDLALTDWLQLRAGKFLTPVGRWNVIHAAPLVWTTSRPLVTEVPFDPHTTGGMVFGSLDRWARGVTYEAFGQFTDQLAPQPTPQRADRSGGGRLEWAGAGGVEVGGTYLAFERDETWSHLTGLDVLWRSRRVELMGELAYVTPTHGPSQWGLYLQAVTELRAHLYLVGRYEHFAPATGQSANLGVAGLAWKPWNPLILKLEYLVADHRVDASPPGVKASVAVLF